MRHLVQDSTLTPARRTSTVVVESSRAKVQSIDKMLPQAQDITLRNMKTYYQELQARS